MNSLHKFIKNKTSDDDHELKPYCFPKMPENDSATSQQGVQCDSSGDQFRLSSFSNQNLHQNTPAEAKDIEQEAYDNGFKKGEADGHKSIENRLQSLMHSFNEGLIKVEEANKAIAMAAEEETVKLAIAISEKILQSEVCTNKDVINNIVTAALKKVVDNKKIKIRCSEADCETLKEHMTELLKINDHFQTITFESDAKLESGGCVVETEFGDIDARIDKQLQVIKEAFNSETQRMKYKG